MQATIDVFDGRGPLNYSNAIDAKHPIRIVRKLNEPSVCSFGLSFSFDTSRFLVRNSRVMVGDDLGNLLFTGYLATEATMEFVGMGIEGPSYVAVVEVISDEVLLDRQVLGPASVTVGQTASSLMTDLTAVVGKGLLGSDVDACTQVPGQFSVKATEPWSTNAGVLAASVRASYRVIDGRLVMAPIGTNVHVLAEGDGTLQPSGLTASRAKQLVNDVTLCGEDEPCAYVTEMFQGDGVSAVFALSTRPFATPSGQRTWITDDFNEPTIDSSRWHVVDPGAHVALTSAGLTFGGGSSIDDTSYVSSTGMLEIGGSLLFEAGGVILGAGSDGILLSLCSGGVSEANCVAGFRVKQLAGAMYVVPIAGGSEAGSSLLVNAGNTYTLRARIYCSEQQRLLQSFYSLGDAGVKQFGGDTIQAGGKILLEVQELINGIPAPCVVLYDGSVATLPSTGNVLLASSANLTASLKSVRVERPVQAWVKTAPLNGGWGTRRIGATSLTGECNVETTGSVRFFLGEIPAAGECISVSYRSSKRAIARLAQGSSVAAEGVGVFPGTSAWAGTLSRPKARSSADCENGARAMLNSSCSRSTALEGTYAIVIEEGGYLPGGDIWPGDMLLLNSSGQDGVAHVVVRQVKLDVTSTAPAVLSYTIVFANDWAQELSLSVSTIVGANAWIPLIPNTPVLGDLTGLTFTVSGGVLALDAGVSPPSGGGFEVRRRDWAFGPGGDSDLVLRSPVQHFSIPRWAATEQYFVRMYDASNPPVYSRVSNAIYLNLPM